MICRTGRCESPCEDCFPEEGRLEDWQIHEMEAQLNDQLDGELCDVGVVAGMQRLEVGVVGDASWIVIIVPVHRVFSDYVYEYTAGEGPAHVAREIKGCSLLLVRRNGEHAFRAGWNGYRIDFGDNDAPEDFHNPVAEDLDRAILVALLGDDAPTHVSTSYPTQRDTRTHEKIDGQWWPKFDA